MNSSSEKHGSTTVLVMRLSALGDIAMTVPALYPVCRANPDVRFVLLTQPWPATMMIEAPENLVIETVDVRGDRMGFWAMWRLAGRLHEKYNFTHVADLHSVIRTWAVDLRLRLAGCRVARIDKGHAEKRDRIRGRRHDQLKTTVERYREVFAKLGLAKVRSTKYEVQSIRDEGEQNPYTTFHPLLQEGDGGGPTGDGGGPTGDGGGLASSPIVPEKAAGERWIAVAPFSQHRGKEYPLESMEQVIDRLAAIPGVHIFLLGGGKQEKLALRPIAHRLKNATSLAEVKHTLADELQLMARCDVMVSMDSANMHLASLVGLTVVSVWGATHPHCGFMGYGQSNDNAVQRDDLDCRPCGVYGENKCRYGDYRCLDIDPQRIVDRVTEVLAG